MAAARPEAKAPATSNSALATAQAIAGLPAWFWVLLLGMALFAGASFLPRHYFVRAPLPRALWTTGQIGAGLVLILLAQAIALVRLAPVDEKLSFKDLFVPFRLWGLVFKRLPQLCLPVWLAGWGLALILSALVVVGGLGHWMTYLPKSGQKNQFPAPPPMSPR